MGINDMGRGVNIDVFSADYESVLQTIKGKYPSAQVCCVNLPDRDPVIKSRTESFNSAIENAVKKAGDNFFVDLSQRSRAWSLSQSSQILSVLIRAKY